MTEDSNLSRRNVVKALGAAGAVGVAGGVVSAEGGDPNQKKIKKLRAATSKYQDLKKAKKDGYVLTDHCVSAEDVGAPASLGAMGFHAINTSLIDTTLDETEPEALVYEKKGDQYNLVAVEFLSTAPADGDPPTLFGHHFHPFPEDLANWALHVWAWKNNPNGLFADFSPRVECPD